MNRFRKSFNLVVIIWQLQPQTSRLTEIFINPAVVENRNKLHRDTQSFALFMDSPGRGGIVNNHHAVDSAKRAGDRSNLHARARRQRGLTRANSAI